MSEIFKLYKRRWFVLFVTSILTLSNSSLWVTFSPIANKADAFYCTTKGCGATDVFSLIYLACFLPAGFVAMWTTDRYGARPPLLLGAWCTFVGILIRTISSVAGISKSSRYPVAILGQVIAAIAQPFTMFLPTKVAAIWFPESQRTIANTAASMSNPLGIVLSFFIAPAIVSSDLPNEFGKQIYFLNVCLCLIALIPLAAASLGIWTSSPPTPPTQTASEPSLSFWKGLKSLFCHKSFLVLVLTLGAGVGVFNAIYTLIQKFLCPKGYSNFFAGLCGALLILIGFVGSTIAAIIVDKTKMYIEVMKVSYGIGAVFACLVAMLSVHSNAEVPLVLAISCFGFFAFSIYPIGLEMGVESTYPVAEASSTGLILISGQIQGIILVLLMNGVSSNGLLRDYAIESCTLAGNSITEVRDWRVSMFIWAGYTCFQASFFILLFNPTYRRMKAEQKSKDSFLVDDQDSELETARE